MVVRANNVAKYYGAELIVHGVSFSINQGESVALVGANGAGKSTLLKMIAGEEHPDEGEISLARGARLAYLAQDPSFPHEHTLWQEMEAALAHLAQWREELRLLEQHISDTSNPQWERWMQQYGELSTRFEHAGGYQVDQRIEYTLSHLGFSPQQYQEPVRQLSGGQKTRAALAAVLLSNPDVLLLDEPTNHLDLQSLEWLDSFLASWRGTLLVISHDRYFLERATTRTFEIASGRLSDYPASYSGYLRLRAERQERLQKEYEAQQEYIARTEEFIRRYKAGQRSKEASGREKRLNRLKANHLIERPQEQKQLHLSLESEARSGERVLSLRNLAVGYPQPGAAPRVLIRAEKLAIERGERVALLGPNGSGKTTLLQTLVGHLPPLQGEAQPGHNVVVGYYAQGHDTLDMDATVLEEILEANPRIGAEQARNLLGQFLFRGDDVFKQVRDLSGGERNRLALAQLTLHTGNLLIMDEPTNHLDMNAREALESVLRNYNGSILFVSHDRSFIDTLADKLWIVEGDRLVEYIGSYSGYRQHLARQQEAANTKPADATGERESQRKTGGEKRGSSPSSASPTLSEDRQRKKRVARLEKEVEQIEAEMSQVSAALEAASKAQDVAQITELGSRYASLEQQLEERYQHWADLAE